jgi:hypothetical protein
MNRGKSSLIDRCEADLPGKSVKLRVCPAGAAADDEQISRKEYLLHVMRRV